MHSTELIAAIDAIACDCLAVRVRMLNRAITAIYDDALRPFGVRVTQLNILIAAAKLGTVRPPEICERLQLDVSTLSRNADRMRQRGWIEFLSEQDARARPFRVTKAGLKLIEKAKPAWDAAQQRTHAVLGSKGVSFLHHAVDQLMGVHEKA